ncbi:hypothetical protein B7494_g3891 [Chlorociboria aeruginascens]|nr:hypothetical protein B7494_g3891 [Chlorociboria aeruginascens]
MSTEHHASLAKKACTRCSTQKRRCDKVVPACGLCTRLHQTCKYALPQASPTGPTSPPGIFLSSGALTPSHLKDAIIQRLGPSIPEDFLSAYRRAIEPWFPIIPISGLRSQLPSRGDQASLEIALLCLSIKLLLTNPPSSGGDDSDPSEFKSLYLYTKSSVASTEGLGINSVLIVQSRILVTLFEVAHGFYPAAYISIGATVQAANALDIHPGADIPPSHFLKDETKQETLLTWCGILILDRYIAVESGSHPSVTRSQSQFLHNVLRPTMCPAHQQEQDRTSPICRLSRLLEASALLDKIHAILNNPTAEHAFNIDELLLTIHAALDLQTILNDEIGDIKPLYAGGLGLCDVALLLAYENGSKVPLVAGVTDHSFSLFEVYTSRTVPNMAQSNSYTQGYSDYTVATHQLRTAELDAAFLLSHIRKTDHILDIGCGPGTITTGFAKYASEGTTVGIDISTDVLQKAKTLAAEANIPSQGPGSVVFKEGNVLERLPYPDETFNIVYCSQLFGHLPPPDLPLKALAEIRRVLKPGGILATRDGIGQHFYPKSLNLDRLWGDNQMRALYKGTPDPEPTGPRMPALLRRAGFDANAGKVHIGAGTRVFSGPEARKWLAWRAVGQLQRGQEDPFRQSWLDAGITEDEIEELLTAVKKWVEIEDAWFVAVMCETLAWK